MSSTQSGSFSARPKVSKFRKNTPRKNLQNPKMHEFKSSRKIPNAHAWGSHPLVGCHSHAYVRTYTFRVCDRERPSTRPAARRGRRVRTREARTNNLSQPSNSGCTGGVRGG